MAGPWEAFQDASVVQLAQNDSAIVAPPRAPVPSSNKVWGDAEAQKAGIYETPGGAPAKSGPWDAFKDRPARAPISITIRPRGVSERFGEMQPPQSGGNDLQSGLEQRTLDLTRGPEASPTSQMAGEMNNLLPAASQGTSPHISNYGGQIVSTDVHEDDAGNILYRDPQTGQLKPTDNSKHVALRDPADGRVKVFNRTEATNEGPVTGVARVLAPGLAVGAPTARAAIPLASRAAKASDIFSTAKAPYRAFDAEAGLTPVTADEAKNLVGRVKGALDAAHLPEEVAKQVHDTVALIAKKGDTALTQLQYVKRAVGKLFQSPDKNVRDGAAVATKEIGRIIAETSPSAAANLKKADAIHSTAMSVQDLQRKADVAGLRTGRAGYGGNAVNSMRQVLSPVVEAAIKGRQTNFKPNEIAAMREIVEGTPATNLLRQAGALSPSKGIGAIAVGGVTGGLTAALGASANKIATILTGKQIERLGELVSKRSPEYAKAVAKSVDRYERAQIELMNNPGPNKLAAYISASRALSSGLTRDGIQISSGDLIRQLTGPIKSAADEQQSPVQGPPGQQ